MNAPHRMVTTAADELATGTPRDPKQADRGAG